MKSANIAIFKSVAGRVRAMERPSWSQPSRERQGKMRKHFKAITNTQMYQRRRDLDKLNSGNGSGGPRAVALTSQTRVNNLIAKAL